MVARWAHNPKVVRSSRASATLITEIVFKLFPFFISINEDFIDKSEAMKREQQLKSSRDCAQKFVVKCGHNIENVYC